MRKINTWFSLFCLWGVASACFGQVRVVKTAGEKIALDTSGLVLGASAAEETFRRTLERNLFGLSGFFVRASPGRGEYSVSGDSSANGTLRVNVRVFEAGRGSSLLAKSFRADASEARRLAHRVADEIIRTITGKPSLFTGRIVAVCQKGKAKELFVMDPDGGGLVQITHDGNISLDPHWGPDGDTLTYTAYVSGYPDVYLIRLSARQRTRISGFPGLNTGGAFSPSGAEIALILSKDGNPELYVMNLSTRALTRVTRTPRAAEASPSWSPDGRYIVYVSDLPGSPQLYIVGRDGGEPRRMTGRVSESVNPCWGQNNLIVYSARLGGRYQVCVLDPTTGESRQITTDDADYETPCWAPDGRHIVCSRSTGYRKSLYLLDTLGDPPIALQQEHGNWTSPKWSAK